jgi:uncharacterized NAD(P)/FAD-binding protein YdhS
MDALSQAFEPASVRIAIVGLGPFGLCVLETLLRHIRDDDARSSWPEHSVVIDIIEPNEAGVGVHKRDLPDYLLLNTACGQLDLFGSRFFSAAMPFPMPSFLQWLGARDYRIGPDGRATSSGDGRPVGSDDFLPRRLFGGYLNWVYQHLAEHAPASVQIRLHQAEAVSVQPFKGREKITTNRDEIIVVDHVFLTTGHTDNVQEEGGAGVRMPYPVADLSSDRLCDRDVAIAGMGLVAVDVITALTTGRGGTFHPGPEPGRLRYQAGGREPSIYLYSRNGLPFLCRPRASVDITGDFRPVACTQEAVRKLQSTRGRLNFREDVLPLIFAEMTIMFYGRHAELADGAPIAATAASLGDAWLADGLQAALEPYRARFGAFDPQELLFGPPQHSFASSEVYERFFYDYLRCDVEEASKSEHGSPMKSAIELLRVLRDTIRQAVEFDGLEEASRLEFDSVTASMINRVVVGPPIQRGAELLALMDAGIVRAPFGPAPAVRSRASERRWLISSTKLDRGIQIEVSAIVTGHLAAPSVDRSQSELLRQLTADRRVRPFKRGMSGAGIDVDRSGHPRNAAGTVEPNITVFGPLAEGSRYFVHYIPSPRSRFRAFIDADAAVAALLARYRSGNQAAAGQAG